MTLLLFVAITLLALMGAPIFVVILAYSLLGFHVLVVAKPKR